ncbi:hypothetical protein Sru01_68920 [Sphaerisporangium rufum]|uniref:DUF305 domain-containing protein n=1 Tax=Sphaerisporangium rufum TaxID=1381558 RepID=A0A919RBX7_9ACTN|nr:DUF305 domain-containing protein [Sphaerisporangium rufum]GII81910.1 hypothetical protein Sru01_68920 [Sphaerisporangium rufum]
MKRAVISAAVVSAVLLAGACAAPETATHDMLPASPMSTTPAHSSAPATGPAADHNDRDIWFAQMMIPHHRQALDMAKPAAKRAGREVKELAERIEAAQGPEIRTMTGWLESWGVPAPDEDGASIGQMDHAMPGMMSDKDMKQLEGLKGAAFDRAFLTMMIQHHQGAITMAEEELGAGVYEPARRMAGAIIAGQSAEIRTMRRLLK